ncbi:MAG: hypothetical protein FE036_02905 [Thermoplasmata archaeon]|nr:MAG: hypothetical protein FE036_02905 [Thermoplasmata archaeon]
MQITYSTMLSKLASFIERKPKTVVAIIIFITLIFASFIPSLKMGTSTRDFMPDNETVRASDRINEYFGENEEPVMIILHGKNVVDGKALKEEYYIGKKIKEIEGVDECIGVGNFVSAICGTEYQKSMDECSNEEIENAFKDLLSSNNNITAFDAEDAKYDFADITGFEMRTEQKNLIIKIDVAGLNVPKFANVEWFVSFKNKVDPAKLNLSYMISTRISSFQWEVGKGLKNFRSIGKNEAKPYIWIGKDGKYMDFPLNASVFIDANKNEIVLNISREELSKYGIAPALANASLPAKLYDIEAGSRVAMPFPLALNGGLLRAIINFIENSFLGNFANRILSNYNVSMEAIEAMLEERESLSFTDLNNAWQIVDTLTINEEFLIKQPFMNDLRNSALMFLSFEDGKAKATLMIAQINGSLSMDSMKDVSRKIVKVVEEEANKKGFKAEITGSSVISYQIDDLTDKSNRIIVPGIFIAIIAILLLNFRKPSYVVISLLGLSLAIIWLFGTMALVGIKFNTLAIALVPLMLGLGVDYSVHIFHNYLHEVRNGKSVREAISNSIKEIGLALILATITTAVSFLSFLTASIPSIRNFGILAAIGIAYTFIIAITFEAALRYLLDRKKKIYVKRSKSRFSAGKIMERLSNILCRHPTKVIAVVGMITLAMGMAAVNVKTSFSLEEFMPKNSEAIKAMEKLPEYFPSAGEDQEYILIEGDVASMDALKGIKKTMENIGDDEYIARLPDGRIKADSIYFVMQDAIKENESLKEKFNIGNDGIPESEKDIVAFYDYLYNNQKYSMRVRNVLHKNGNKYDASVIRIYTKLTHLENSNEVMKKLYEDLKGDVSNYGNAKATVTGSMVLIYTIMNSLTRSQFSSTIVCIVIAGIVVILAYRKPLLGFFTMLPVIISSIWIMGTIYLAGYSLNVMTVMVTSLTIGLGITYAIHVVERFRLVADTTGDVLHAVEEAIENTGQAVLMAALTTVAGFVILIFSPMPPEQQFGFITATTIMYSFITTMLLIPPLLLIWGKWRKRKRGYIISP